MYCILDFIDLLPHRMSNDENIKKVTEQYINTITEYIYFHLPYNLSHMHIIIN